MFSRWTGLGILFAALLIGDQIRLGRPEYKYRLTVEVETSQGLKSASGVMSVHPNRGYTGSGSTRTQTRGDAVFVNLGDNKNLVMLLLHGASQAKADEMNYLPITALVPDAIAPTLGKDGPVVCGVSGAAATPGFSFGTAGSRKLVSTPYRSSKTRTSFT